MRLDARVVAGVALWLAITGCATSPTAPDDAATVAAPFEGDARSALNAAWQRWRAQRAESYDFTVSVFCFCPPRFTTIVRFHVRQGVSETQDVDPALRAWFSRFETIDAIFEELSAILDHGPFRFSASYHPLLGYPTSVAIDYEEFLADDELGLGVVDFSVLP
ncbi:MAG: DUF6174 domain-containing protein [Vicinamibacterales bacterium]